MMPCRAFLHFGCNGCVRLTARSLPSGIEVGAVFDGGLAVWRPLAGCSLNGVRG